MQRRDALKRVQDALANENLADVSIDLARRETVLQLIAARNRTTSALGILADVLLDAEAT